MTFTIYNPSQRIFSKIVSIFNVVQQIYLCNLSSQKIPNEILHWYYDYDWCELGSTIKEMYNSESKVQQISKVNQRAIIKNVYINIVHIPMTNGSSAAIHRHVMISTVPPRHVVIFVQWSFEETEIFDFSPNLHIIFIYLLIYCIYAL